jgi:hypothetical protein
LFPNVKIILHALKLDSPTLFQILNQAPNHITIFIYDNHMIETVKDTRLNKDATFNAVFDMVEID